MAQIWVPESQQRRIAANLPFEIQRKIQDGDPTIGWSGDPTLYLQLGDDNSWEVWQIRPDAPPRLAMRHTHNLDNSILVHLREIDPRQNTVDKLVQKAYAKLEADKQAKNQKDAEKLAEGQDRVRYVIKKELG